MKQIMGWRKVCHFYGGLNGSRGDEARSAESGRDRENWIKRPFFSLGGRSVRSPRTDTLSNPDLPEWLSLGKKGTNFDLASVDT